MNFKMLGTSACNWCISVLLIPVALFLIWVFVYMHDLDANKATKEEVGKLDVKFTEQLTRNTVAVEGLTRSIDGLGGALNGIKQARSERR